MNAHPELRTNVQHDFDVFSKESLKKVVEAAARVRDITGIENDEDEVFEEQVRQLCKLEVEASASYQVVQQVSARCCRFTQCAVCCRIDIVVTLLRSTSHVPTTSITLIRTHLAHLLNGVDIICQALLAETNLDHAVAAEIYRVHRNGP